MDKAAGNGHQIHADHDPAGTATIEQQHSVPGGEKRPLAGSTVPQTECALEDIPLFSWAQIDAKEFQVRHGPEYAQLRNKEASLHSLYELAAIDWYVSDHRLRRVGDMVELPSAEFSHPSVPSLFVINVQLPMEGPSLVKSAKEDGDTLHAVFYYALRKETAEALQDVAAAEPAVKLLVEYCSRAPYDPAMRKRFKTLAVVHNLSVIGMSKLVSPFNGKPVLITESGSLVRGSRHRRSEQRDRKGDADQADHAQRDRSGSGAPFERDDYLEMDVNVRKWCYLARKGLHKLEPKFDAMKLSTAFLIEGRENDELPEQVLGCASINGFDVRRAKEVGGAMEIA